MSRAALTSEVGGLRQAVETATRHHLGNPAAISAVERRRSPYSTSFAIDDVVVTLADGTGVQFVLKHLSPSTMLGPALGVKPDFVFDPRREAEVYLRVLSGAGLGTATCHAVLDDGSADGRWLLLEKVAGVELYQVGALGVWLDVSRWLARMHQRFAGRTPVSSVLLRYDAEYYRAWPARALTFASADRERGCALRWLASNWDDLVAALVELPTTFVHGELYPSNVLVSEGPAGTRVCPVDWEMAGVGPGLLDLAALSTGWNDRAAARMAAAYREALGGEGNALEEAAVTRALDDCRLLLCMQWLGWAPGWAPPAENRQDWLALAVRLAERRGW